MLDISELLAQHYLSCADMVLTVKTAYSKRMSVMCKRQDEFEQVMQHAHQADPGLSPVMCPVVINHSDTHWPAVNIMASSMAVMSIIGHSSHARKKLDTEARTAPLHVKLSTKLTEH